MHLFITLQDNRLSSRNCSKVGPIWEWSSIGLKYLACLGLSLKLGRWSAAHETKLHPSPCSPPPYWKSAPQGWRISEIERIATWVGVTGWGRNLKNWLPSLTQRLVRILSRLGCVTLWFVERRTDLVFFTVTDPMGLLLHAVCVCVCVATYGHNVLKMVCIMLASSSILYLIHPSYVNGLELVPYIT